MRVCVCGCVCVGGWGTSWAGVRVCVLVHVCAPLSCQIVNAAAAVRWCVRVWERMHVLLRTRALEAHTRTHTHSRARRGTRGEY